MKLICPRIHLNGTGKDALLEAIEGAFIAIDNAVDAMKKTAPNGRDYYVYQSNTFEEARQQYWARMEKLKSVMDELTAIATGIHDEQQYVEVPDCPTQRERRLISAMRLVRDWDVHGKGLQEQYDSDHGTGAWDRLTGYTPDTEADDA